jgi:hypothetical protein
MVARRRQLLKGHDPSRGHLETQYYIALRNDQDWSMNETSNYFVNLDLALRARSVNEQRIWRPSYFKSDILHKED